MIQGELLTKNWSDSRTLALQNIMYTTLTEQILQGISQRNEAVSNVLTQLTDLCIYKLYINSPLL